MPLRIAVLVVDDDPADVELTREALMSHEGDWELDIQVAEDGEEALNYLKQQGIFEGSKRPDIILLDLNMPKKDGREVMQELKSDEQLRTIPVVVVTTSDDQRDISKMYELGANCYLTKPEDLEGFSELYRVLESFWFKTAKLPPRKE